MMQRFFIYLICLMAGFADLAIAQQKPDPKIVSAQHIGTKSTLSGRITDQKTGSPLAGASIFFHEAKTGAISNDQGNYKSPELPAGKYLVEIAYQGYATIVAVIQINGPVIRDFALVESVVEHEEVTVTGVASATRTKLSPQAISILKKNDLLQSSSTNIIDAIGKLVPGVSGLSTGPAISKPVIRGLGSNRVVTVHDGVRQEGQQWGDEHGIEIDEYSIQKVEVLKGPASLFYGSDAMAGVVHLITNVPVQKGTVAGSWMSQINSNDGLLGTSANLAGHLNNGFNWNAYGTIKSAGDYRNAYDGKVFNSRFGEHNLGGYFGLNKSWGYSHLLISHVDQEIGIVEGARNPINGQFLVYPETPMEHTATDAELNSRTMMSPYQHISHFKLASDNNFVLGSGRMAVNIGFQDNRRREFGEATEPSHPSMYFDLKTINYNIQYHFAESKGWMTSIGLTGMQQQNRNLSERILIPAYNLFDIGSFIYSKKSFDRITVSGGLRVDYRSLDAMDFREGNVLRFAAFQKSFSNISGSVGISYAATDEITWKFNIARGYRAPGVSELASNGAHEGTNRWEFGDVQLKSETAFQVDAGFELNKDHLSFAINTFYNRIQNYIFYSRLESVRGGDSLIHVGNDFIPAFKFRQAIATLYGFEAKLDIHPHPLDWLHFENNFSLVAAHFDQSFEGTNKLPFIPAPKLQSVLRANFFKHPSGLSNGYLKLEYVHIATQNRIFSAYDTETATPGYHLLNIGAGTDISSKGKLICSIHIGLNNITDVAYQNHLSRLKYTDINAVSGRTGVFEMGRNFTMKLNVPLNFKLKNNSLI